MLQNTYSPGLSFFQRSWYLIDAEGIPAGRLATFIARVLMGKHKAAYAPHLDCGDSVVVVNTSKVFLTGKKMDQKVYHRHSGYPGGLKSTTAVAFVRKNQSDRILLSAVKGMLKKGPLGSQQIRHLYLYPDVEHKHQAQDPKLICSKVVHQGRRYGSWR